MEMKKKCDTLYYGLDQTENAKADMTIFSLSKSYLHYTNTYIVSLSRYFQCIKCPSDCIKTLVS